jgi:hypothetical protein
MAPDGIRTHAPRCLRAALYPLSYGYQDAFLVVNPITPPGLTLIERVLPVQLYHLSDTRQLIPSNKLLL